MKEVVETVVKHPFASAFVIAAFGRAIATIIHGKSWKPVTLYVSETKAKTEA